jgi:cyclase
VAAPASTAAQETPGWDVAVEHLRGSVYLVEATKPEAHVNLVASIGPDGALLSDTGVDDYADALARALTETAGGTLDIRRIVNTHYHGDHTGGNARFGEGAIIAAHPATSASLESGARFGPGPLEPHALPGQAVADSATVDFNGDTVRLIHIPRAHTDGDLAVHFVDADVLHVGDIVLEEGSLPYTRFPRDFADAIDVLAARAGPNTVVVPGHGAPLDRAALQRLAAIVRETVAYVDEALDTGITPAEIVAERPRSWDEWDSRYLTVDDWIAGLLEEPAQRERGVAVAPQRVERGPGGRIEDPARFE